MTVIRHNESITERPLTARSALINSMRQTFHAVEKRTIVNETQKVAVTDALNTLEAAPVEMAPVNQLLAAVDLSPKAFMVFLVNALVRVLPTYVEIPINLAAHGLTGDLRSYGLIALNVNDEAGGGVPHNTHPMLFNRSAAALSDVFSVPPLSINIGRAALAYRRHSSFPAAGGDALAAVDWILRTDDLGRTRLHAERLDATRNALTYAPLITQAALECYEWRIDSMARLCTSILRDDPLSHRAYLTLTAMLAVREAAAADPNGLFASLSAFVRRYGSHLAGSSERLSEGVIWAEAHVDADFGIQAGYDGHSVEDDHAIQAASSVIAHIQDADDLLTALEAMNAVNTHLLALWAGTAESMCFQRDEPLPAEVTEVAAHNTRLS